ncbi:Squamous cell carcinoma antigen recognized by T-cells 3-like protein [Dirofilaria immitis]|nr:Squamous cell carcinoma antigen recognized by T-cells 3-like protein [Dirofilaria immitis]
MTDIRNENQGEGGETEEQNEEEVENSPKDYSNRMKLIEALRRSGELEAVREQRECISASYTMPPNFWLEWIEDEKSAGSDKNRIKSLFKRAVRDFHSPEVYLEYVQWACGISLEFAREKMEEAVTKIGLRADCASLIWNIYLDFEKMILNSMVGAENEKQRKLVESLYGRFLHIPHLGLQESWNEYKAFADGEESEQIHETFERSATRMADINEFEERLQCAMEENEKLSILMEYIAFEMQTDDLPRIQMIFERALCTLAAFPNSDLWLQYCNWLDATLKLSQVSVDVYARSVCHAPSSALWQQYFSALERSNASPQEIDAKWPDARNAITTQEEGFFLYRTYIYLLRRRIAKQGSDDYTSVLEKFDEGAAFLAEKFGSHWDSPKAQYRKNHALFYIHWQNSLKKEITDMIVILNVLALKIWNDILASGSGHLAAAWIEAANLERFLVFDALIQFEREVGTIEELDKALEKVNAQAGRISLRPQKNKMEKTGKKRKKENEEDENEQELVIDKDELVNGAMETATKIHKNTELKINGGAEILKLKFMADSNAVIITKNLFAIVIVTVLSDVMNVDKKQVDGDGFVVPQLPTQLSRPKTTSGQDVGLEGTSKEASNEQRHTVFVSNLDFKLPTERLEEIFPNAKEIRLIYRGMSKLHKGFGYVDFLTEAEAREALKMDRTQIDGRPVYVSEYKPHDKGRNAEFRYSTGLERNKIFINNVHYDATEEQLKEIFAIFGKIRDIRIVTHKSGKSKGCAYIEYENDDEAAKAVKAGEDLILLERKLSVAISNPPKRKEQMQRFSLNTASSSHQRNKIDLIPRTLARTAKVAKSVENGSSSSSNGSGESVKNMSNEQFRSFLK